MDNKDYIYVYDDIGKKIKMELILAINSEDGQSQYIAYKQEDKVIPIYLAKIKLENGVMDLDTNLSDDEKRFVEGKLKEKIIGGKNV